MRTKKMLGIIIPVVTVGLGMGCLTDGALKAEASKITYDEDNNCVTINEDIYVVFDQKTDELIGITGDKTLNLEEQEQRNQLILTEIKNFFGEESEKFQSVVLALEKLNDTTYDEENNCVKIGENLTVFFDVETDEFIGLAENYGDLDMETLSDEEKEARSEARNELVLTEIEKLFGKESKKYQNSILALEKTNNTTYDEENNCVKIGENLTVFFDVETDEFIGLAENYGDLDMETLSDKEKEARNEARNELVLTEIEKLFGKESKKYQNTVVAVEKMNH